MNLHKHSSVAILSSSMIIIPSNKYVLAASGLGAVVVGTKLPP